MRLGFQVLPIIFVDNNTKETLEDIYFTYDGYKSDDPKINRIKSGDRGMTSITNKNYEGVKTLYMYHFDKNNVKHQYEIFDKLDTSYWSNIRVEINSIKADGSFDFKVELRYDYTN